MSWNTTWTWSAVVLPIFTIASVIAATISRFCWSVRPAYHCTVMLGMVVSSPRLLESPQIVGEIGGERVRLHGSVGVEAHGEILADLAARVALAVEPAPGGVAAVEPHLIGLAEHAQQRRLVGLARGDRARVGRWEIVPEPDRDAAAENSERDQEQQPAGRAHAADDEGGPRALSRRSGAAESPTCPRASTGSS